MHDGGTKDMLGDASEFISFIAGDQNFCIEIAHIREIRRWEPITMLPHSPEFVLGVVNLRGAVIPIIDLAVKLGFQRISPTKRNVIIIVNYGGKMVGLLVDAVSEILTVGAEEFKEAPKLSEGTINHMVCGVVSVGDNMTRVLDLQLLLSDETKIDDAA